MGVKVALATTIVSSVGCIAIVLSQSQLYFNCIVTKSVVLQLYCQCRLYCNCIVSDSPRNNGDNTSGLRVLNIGKPVSGRDLGLERARWSMN